MVSLCAQPDHLVPRTPLPSAYPISSPSRGPTISSSLALLCPFPPPGSPPTPHSAFPLVSHSGVPEEPPGGGYECCEDLLPGLLQGPAGTDAPDGPRAL